MNRLVSWLLATLVGVGVGTGVFVWLVSSVAFAGIMALSWGVGVSLALRHETLMFGSAKARGRTASLWSGAFVGFLTLVAFFGTIELPIADELGFALSLLVLGVGFASLQFGIGMARAYHDEATTTDESERLPS